MRRLVPDTIEPARVAALEWQDRSLCREVDGEIFYPEKGESTQPAKRVCMGCEVRTECLSYALANREAFGVWGGLSERERRRLLPTRVPRPAAAESDVQEVAA